VDNFACSPNRTPARSLTSDWQNGTGPRHCNGKAPRTFNQHLENTHHDLEVN